MLQGIYASNPTNFQFSFVFAATDPGTSRTLQFTLQQAGAAGTYVSGQVTDWFSMRLVEGTTVGLLTLQAYGGSSVGWLPVAANAFLPSQYNSGTNSFSTFKAYNLAVNYSAATNTYSVTYGAVGGSSTTVPNLNYFVNPTNGQPLASVEFMDNAAGATGFAVDNVSVLAVPEPRVGPVMGAAIALTLLIKARRKRGLA